MYELPKFSYDLCAALLSSSSNIDAIIEQSKKLSTGRDFVLLLKPSKGLEGRLIPAYIGAMVRQSEGTMHSNSLAMETLLFVSGTMNIGNAIARAGADGKKFVIFSSKKSLLDLMVRKFGLKVLKNYSLVLDPRASGNVAITAIKDDK